MADEYIHDEETAEGDLDMDGAGGEQGVANQAMKVEDAESVMLHPL